MSLFKNIFRNNEEFDSTLLIFGAMIVWILQNAANIFIEGYAGTPASDSASRFVDSIVLMVFTYKCTKSRPQTGDPQGKEEEEYE